MILKPGRVLPGSQALKRLNQDVPVAQARVLEQLLQAAEGTRFAREHGLRPGLDFAAYQARVPLRTYADYERDYLGPFPGQSLNGVLTNSPVLFLGRTSGSSSGREKYLPITAAFLADNRRGAMLQSLFHVLRTGDPGLWLRRPLWLSDMSNLFYTGPYLTGTTSRLMRHVLPFWLNHWVFPGPALLRREPAEQRLAYLVQMALRRDFSLISGLTPWLEYFFRQVLHHGGGAQLTDLWPSLRIIAHAGVDFRPHAARLQALAGPGVTFVETYVATEGFMALQDLEQPLLRFLPAHGLLYEFVSEHSPARRLGLWEIETGVDYALYVSNRCGLWSLEVGDRICFERLHPWPLFRVVGRLADKCDFFGEKLLLAELRAALHLCDHAQQACLFHFHVGPDHARRGLRLLLEFTAPPADHAAYFQLLDHQLRVLNTQFDRNRSAGVNAAPAGQLLPAGTFLNWLSRQPGQTKLPFLSTDAEQFQHFCTALGLS
jgi:hypothetical protein